MIRIGTRDSKLALWQAEHVAAALASTGNQTEIIFIKTEGDLVLDTPLPLMGGKGVFTKALDDALLENRIDIAVHSHKDIPTQLPDGLTIVAVFEREDPRDVLVMREDHPLTPEQFMDGEINEGLIATSSIRRAGQWLHRFPQHNTTDIRGNVQTRLRKLDKSNWDGAIFAAAGLKRLGLEHRISAYLDWMICAPAQGAVAVMAREEDRHVFEAFLPHHHLETALSVRAERACLSRLEGGCSAPVGVYVRKSEDGSQYELFANVLSPDGKLHLDVNLQADATDAEAVVALGLRAANALLEAGAADIIGKA
ncbi:MAG: hydroxymethylbilane synthase [Bacteroidetes bacterium]|nr:hydroxymethylbilane synthase [Bacteroidota bacterium]MCH8525181.1 hydroxymethylbilane synthase [Balneolales bacterium]